MSNHQSHGRTRRGFLGLATVGVGATIGGVVAAPLAGYALASAGQETKFRPAPLGPVSRFTSESGFAPTAADYVEDPTQPLVSISGHQAYTSKGQVMYTTVSERRATPVWLLRSWLDDTIDTIPQDVVDPKHDRDAEERFEQQQMWMRRHATPYVCVCTATIVAGKCATRSRRERQG